MPTIGNPDRTAVLALHYQNEVLHPDGAIRLGVAKGDEGRSAVIGAATRLLAGARKLGVPVLHVRIAFGPGHRDVIQNCTIFRNVAAGRAMVDGSWGAEFYKGMAPVAGETVILHRRVNAFYQTGLQECLDRLGIGHLVIAGVATNSVVETTGRHAADVGWLVTVARDACSAADRDLHRAALANMALLGEVEAVDAIVARNFDRSHP